MTVIIRKILPLSNCDLIMKSQLFERIMESKSNFKNN